MNAVNKPNCKSIYPNLSFCQCLQMSLTGRRMFHPCAMTTAWWVRAGVLIIPDKTRLLELQERHIHWGHMAQTASSRSRVRCLRLMRHLHAYSVVSASLTRKPQSSFIDSQRIGSKTCGGPCIKTRSTLSKTVTVVKTIVRPRDAVTLKTIEMLASKIVDWLAIITRIVKEAAGSSDTDLF